MASLFSMKLRSASFKGVPFHVSDVKKTVIRRKILHEYPQRDIPFIEDLGKGATKYSVTAFLVGDDCVSKAKKLEKALLSTGAGTFVHPWEGNLTVSVFDAGTIHYNNGAHRYCDLQITFVEAGELSFPAMSADSVTLARQLANKLSLSAASDFMEAFKTGPLYQFVESAVNGTLLETLGVISNSELTQIFDLADDCLDLITTGADLLSSDHGGFSDRLVGILGLSRFASTKARWSAVTEQLSDLADNDVLSANTKVLSNQEDAIGDIEALRLGDTSAVETLMRRTLISQAIGAATLIGTDVDVTASSEDTDEESTQQESMITISIDELQDVRDKLLDRLDAELLLPITNDEIFIELLQARSTVFTLLTQKAEGLSRLVEVDTKQNEPSLVVASDYYDDATRESEIVIRNKIPHSGFCPTDLKILSE